MSALATKIVAVVAAWGSGAILVLALRTPGKDLSLGLWFAVAVTVAGAVYAISAEVRDWHAARSHIHDLASGPAVDEYLHRWIEKAGRVAIFSRNMSWADSNPRIVDLLREKARCGDLVLALPEEIPLSKELTACGADVRYYGTKYVLRSRFTIVNVDRPDSAVAIGHQKGGRHTIVEFRGDRNDPAFYLAKDLLGLIRARTAKAK